MPTLLQIDSCLNMLSTGRITESIGRLAIDKGWDCYIVHGARYTRPGSCMHSYQTVSKLCEYCHFVESLLFDNHGLSSRAATKRVVEYIKEIKPDVVQLHCVHGYYINYHILFEYLNNTNIPVVWTFHDCWAFTGHCAHFVTAGCEKWKKEGCHDCPLKGDYPKSLIDCSTRNYNLKSFIFKQSKYLHIVTVSKWLENMTKQSFLGDKPIQTIYNGIDMSVFYPKDSKDLKERLGLEGKKVLLAAATSWSSLKGYDDYIKLSKILPNDYVIILIGLNDKQIKSLPSNMVGLKRTDSACELADYYSMADIILNLSYQETFGLTTVEGMACGTPGIVYNVTASPELITSRTGIVVQPGNVGLVYDAITEIIGKGKDFYSASCRQRAIGNFDKNDRFMDYIKLYESLIAK